MPVLRQRRMRRWLDLFFVTGFDSIHCCGLRGTPAQPGTPAETEREQRKSNRSDEGTSSTDPNRLQSMGDNQEARLVENEKCSTQRQNQGC